MRRLTNAALMSKGRSIDERALARPTELRLVRSWIGRGLVDALPFGSSLGRASVRAARRIDGSDLGAHLRRMRGEPGGPEPGGEDKSRRSWQRLPPRSDGTRPGCSAGSRGRYQPTRKAVIDSDLPT